MEVSNDKESPNLFNKKPKQARYAASYPRYILNSEMRIFVLYSCKGFVKKHLFQGPVSSMEHNEVHQSSLPICD